MIRLRPSEPASTTTAVKRLLDVATYATRGHDYGASVREIFVQTVFPLSSMRVVENTDPHHLRWVASLPTASLNRKKQRASVEYMSAVDEAVLERVGSIAANLNASFDVLMKELCGAIALLGKKVRAKDDFRVDALIADLAAFAAGCPRDDERWRQLVADAERFAEEVDERAEVQHAPKLDAGQFWRMVGDADTVPALTKQLAGRSPEEIVGFQELLANVLYDLDRRDIADACGTSGDGFLYARCGVVMRGEQFVKAVLADPQLAKGVPWCEPLLYAAEQAFERRTGGELTYVPTRSWESGSNLRGWSRG